MFFLVDLLVFFPVRSLVCRAYLGVLPVSSKGKILEVVNGDYEAEMGAFDVEKEPEVENGELERRKSEKKDMGLLMFCFVKYLLTYI